MKTRVLFLPLLTFMFLASCDDAGKPTVVTVTEPQVQSQSSEYSATTFENTDSTGKFLGFGYDVFTGSKRMIHQTTIPGEAGINGFVSAEEAERVARLVITKLESGSGFPTVSRNELDSLKITLQPDIK